LYLNIFENPDNRGPLARTTRGIGLTLAVVGAIGLGCGVAGASPQQAVLVDDPVPVAGPAGPDPAAIIDVANALLRPFNSLFGSVLPGGGSLIPGTSGGSPLSPAGGYPSLLSPGQTPTSPDYPAPLTPTQTTPISSADTGPVI
jgi:hypothetical protein